MERSPGTWEKGQRRGLGKLEEDGKVCQGGQPVPQSGKKGKHSHLFGDSPGALYELLLGVGVTGATLQGTGLGDQSRAAVPQLLYPMLDVGTYL